MKKKIILSLTVVLLLLCSLTFSSCFTLIAAASEDGKYASDLKKEATLTGGKGINWRSEIAYDESKNKNMDSTGTWYIDGIPINFQNLSADSQYNGISIMRCIQNNSYVFTFALVETDDQPAGEESSFTIKKLGDSGDSKWIIKYILSVDGNSFDITDFGGLNSPPLRVGQYISSQANTAARNAALEGYAELTVTNMNSSLSISAISVNGNNYSRNYQVNLRPSSGMMPGGSYKVGDNVSGKTVVPVGNYSITVRWSNGAQSTQTASVTDRGIMINFANP